MYTVKQLSDLAGVSVRTLHYYDEIGLLKPSAVGDNGYRYYGDESLLALQQILFFREMDLGLLQIKDILNSPAFDLLAALRQHRDSLEQRIQRLRTLVQTVDSTIMHLAGEITMTKKNLFAGFSEEKQKEYEREIAEKHPDWDQDKVRESQRRWKSYTAQDKQKIGEEGMAVYNDLIAAMPHGPASAEAQAVMARWHQHLRYFYEPTPEILRGLGQMYNEHPDFIANFKAMHPDLPEFLSRAVSVYVERLGE
ncbi:MAG: MerR family transcriptional regulator [Anaerolineae bacterium]|nr:MerR family transcriptional regulator [Anaerolineae bacterium]